MGLTTISLSIVVLALSSSEGLSTVSSAVICFWTRSRSAALRSSKLLLDIKSPSVMIFPQSARIIPLPLFVRAYYYSLRLMSAIKINIKTMPTITIEI